MTAIDDPVKIVHDHADRIFSWNYDRSRGQLVTLYNKAMASQWNSVTELDWSTDVDPEGLVDLDTPMMRLTRAAIDEPGSPIASWGERELTAVAIEMYKAQLSQFMHGEQGAMMTAAKLVETVPWIDAKYYAATQTMDEARHTEVFAKYLHTKLGEAYPMSPFLDEQITALLEDSRWDIAYLGMQIVIESLALAAFGTMLRNTDEPLLRKLLRYVMSDEARHVAFGVLSLKEFYDGLTASEIRSRQEFAFEAARLLRNRFFAQDVWERLGVDPKAVIDFMQTHEDPGAEMFQQMLFSKIVPNCKKLGLLDAGDGWLRDRFTDLGIIQFENWTDTSEEYGSLDAVAADRAGASSASSA
jgi:hypothetical protein